MIQYDRHGLAQRRSRSTSRLGHFFVDRVVLHVLGVGVVTAVIAVQLIRVGNVIRPQDATDDGPATAVLFGRVRGGQLLDPAFRIGKDTSGLNLVILREVNLRRDTGITDPHQGFHYRQSLGDQTLFHFGSRGRTAFDLVGQAVAQRIDHGHSRLVQVRHGSGNHVDNGLHRVIGNVFAILRGDGHRSGGSNGFLRVGKYGFLRNSQGDRRFFNIVHGVNGLG